MNYINERKEKVGEMTFLLLHVYEGKKDFIKENMEFFPNVYVSSV